MNDIYNTIIAALEESTEKKYYKPDSLLSTIDVFGLGTALSILEIRLPEHKFDVDTIIDMSNDNRKTIIDLAEYIIGCYVWPIILLARRA